MIFYTVLSYVSNYLFHIFLYCFWFVYEPHLGNQRTCESQQQEYQFFTNWQQCDTHIYIHFQLSLIRHSYLGYGIKAYQGNDYLEEQYFQVNRTSLNSTSFSVAVQIIGLTNILLLKVPYIAIDPTFPLHINSFDNFLINQLFSAGLITNIILNTLDRQTYKNTINIQYIRLPNINSIKKNHFKSIIFIQFQISYYFKVGFYNLLTIMLLFLFLSFFSSSVRSLFTAAPIWVTSDLVRAANQKIISTPTGNTSTPTYTFIFSSALSGTPFLGYGIKAYEGSDYLVNEQFEVNRTALTSTSFSVKLQILGTTTIVHMNVPYIAIDPTFPHHINSFDNVPVNYAAGALTNISVNSTQSSYTNIINYTAQATGLTYSSFQLPLSRNKVLLFLSSLFIFGVNQHGTPPWRPIDFRVSTSIVSTSQYQIKVTLSKNMTIVKLHFSMIIFDETDVLSSGNYTLIYQRIDLPYTGGFIPVPIQFIQNFIMGIIDFSSNKSTTILDFQWDFQNVSGVHGVLMPVSVGYTNSDYGAQTINRAGYTLFYLKTWICPNVTFEIFFDPSLNLCTACPIINCLDCYNLTACTTCDELNNFFLNTTTQQCSLCTLEGCLDCLNFTVCQVCNSSSNYSLVNGVCEYCNNSLNIFLNFSNQCQLCPLSYCIQCFNLSSCSLCDLNNSYYLPPSSLICAYCNFTSDMFINSSTNQCEQCNLTGCIDCWNLTVCITCNIYEEFYLVNGTCIGCQFLGNCSICGNGVPQIIQDCDDGNLNSYDGCSSLCELQQLFECSKSGSCLSTFFIFRESLLIDKSKCNEFVLKFKTSNTDFLSSYDKAYFINDGVSITSKSKQNDQVSYTVSYNRDIYNESLQLRIPLSTFKMRLSPNQGLPLLVYSSTECNALDTSKKIVEGIKIIGFIILFISLLSGKIVGLQLFGVLQLAYFSLAEHDFHNIYLSALTGFKIFNGLNLPFFSESSSISLPPNLEVMNIHPSFVNNCNIMLVLLFLELFIAGFLYLISKMIKSQKLKKISLRLMKEGFITLVMFNVFNISFSTGIHLKYYGANDFNQLLSIIAICFTLFAVFVATIVLPFLSENQYGEFKQKFKDGMVCRSYISFSIVYRIIIGLYIAIKNDYTEATLLVLAFSFAFILYNIVNLPFKDAYQNYRCNIVHITQLITLLCANYYRSMKANTPIQIKGHNYSPAILQIIMIIICIVISSLALVYQVVKKIKQNKDKKKNQIEKQKNDHRNNATFEDIYQQTTQ